MPPFLHCAGRVRKKGEMNGKSNNMNNVLQQIYPTGCYIPPDELIAVFDADQVQRSFDTVFLELQCWPPK
jgi:endoglucanase